MASIKYIPLSALQPLELEYQYYSNERLKNNKIYFRDGYNIYHTDALHNFQDVTVNNDTCLILTSTVDLKKTFTVLPEYNLGSLPGSIYFQPRNSSSLFAFYDIFKQQITLSLTEKSTFYIFPIFNTNEVEILVNNRYLQVEEEYPFTVKVDNIPLPQQLRYRQRFECVYQNSTITFKTKTKDGNRYLAFSSDNILRATGLNLNNKIYNDYLFACTPVTREKIAPGFDPDNTVGTYFYDFETEINNKNLTVNKALKANTHLLFSFPTKRENGFKVPINIANLKTNITPLGAPPPINNL
jgi:hypothetical protein